MKLVVAGLFLVALAISQSSTPPAAAPASALGSVATDAADSSNSTSIVDDQDEGAICPLKWFCDDTGLYYSTKAACTSACSSTCYRDYECTGGCICP